LITGALTILPASAAVATRVRGSALMRAAIGCVLLGAGVLTLAFIPLPSVWWLVAPEVLAGFGIGLALPALAGGLLPERTATEAGRLLAARHAGIALTLLALAPLVAGQIDAAEHHARLEGVAALLESGLTPPQKLALAPSLASALKSSDPRGAIAHALVTARSRVSRSYQGALTELANEGDTLVVQVASDGLEYAFLITGALGLLAAFLLRPPRLREASTVLVTSSLALPIGYALASRALEPASPKLGTPCHPVSIPDASGFSGLLKSSGLATLDRIACAEGISREQAILNLVGAG
jgi:hypothetical protein